jgi:hypothetical protein
MESAVPLTLKVLLWLSELVCCTVRQTELLNRCGPQDHRQLFPSANYSAASGIPSRRFPKPWSNRCPVDRVIDANGMILAHVYGEPEGAIMNDRSCHDEPDDCVVQFARWSPLVQNAVSRSAVPAPAREDDGPIGR